MLWDILISLAIGALIGWFAGLVMKVRHGLLLSIIIGIVGSALGRFIAGLIGITAGTISIGGILISLAGACLLIFLCRLIFGKK